MWMTAVLVSKISQQYLTPELKRSNNMQALPKQSSRKKFLLLTGAAFLSASILRAVRGKRKEKAETVKMLTQDGTLVEIDRTQVRRAGKIISDKELQQWVKNKPNQE
jgi:hypothetical protein